MTGHVTAVSSSESACAAGQPEVVTAPAMLSNTRNAPYNLALVRYMYMYMHILPLFEHTYSRIYLTLFLTQKVMCTKMFKQER